MFRKFLICLLYFCSFIIILTYMQSTVRSIAWRFQIARVKFDVAA